MTSGGYSSREYLQDKATASEDEDVVADALGQDEASVSSKDAPLVVLLGDWKPRTCVVNHAMSCVLSYHDHTRFEAKDASNLLDIECNASSKLDHYISNITKIAIWRPLTSSIPDGRTCTVGRLRGAQAYKIFECAARLIPEDGVSGPEVRMNAVSYIHLMDIDSLELHVRSKRKSKSFRCSLTNIGKCMFSIKAHIGHEDDAFPMKVLLSVPSFMPLDTIHCRSDRPLRLRLVLERANAYSLLMWTPSSCTFVRKVVPSLTEISTCVYSLTASKGV